MHIRTALGIAAALNAGMFFIEGAGGLYAGSAALLLIWGHHTYLIDCN